MRILMATDGSVHASTAMLTATRLLGSKRAEIDVVCVGPEPTLCPVGVETRVQVHYEKQIASQLQRTLKEAQGILSQLHVRTQGVLEFGSPAERLVRRMPNYDLTVVGAYGIHERKQPGLGPVASRLLQQGHGNLMIGRELVNEHNFRVLVALDSSEASLKAVESLPRLFDPASLEVTLMHVIEMAWASPLSDTQNDGIDFTELNEYERQLGRELRQTASTVMENALRHLEQWSIPASSIIKEGDPALEICSEAERGGYDLVLAGANGASDVKHALLGSVSLKLAWDAPASVCIVRNPVE